MLNIVNPFIGTVTEANATAYQLMKTLQTSVTNGQFGQNLLTASEFFHATNLSTTHIQPIVVYSNIESTVVPPPSVSPTARPSLSTSPPTANAGTAGIFEVSGFFVTWPILAIVVVVVAFIICLLSASIYKKRFLWCIPSPSSSSANESKGDKKDGDEKEDSPPREAGTDGPRSHLKVKKKPIAAMAESSESYEDDLADIRWEANEGEDLPSQQREARKGADPLHFRAQFSRSRRYMDSSNNIVRSKIIVGS